MSNIIFGIVALVIGVMITAIIGTYTGFWFLAVVLQIASAVAAYGISLGYWCGEYPDLVGLFGIRDDIIFSIAFSLMGIPSLILITIFSGFVKHGMRFK